MKIEFGGGALPRSGVVVGFAYDSGILAGSIVELDKRLNGKVSQAVKSSKFQGKREQVLDIIAPGGTIPRVMVMGLGKNDGFTAREVELLGGAIAGVLLAAKVEVAAVLAKGLGIKTLGEGEVSALLASGAALRTYKFETYKTKRGDSPTDLKNLTIQTSHAVVAKRLFGDFEAVRQGNHLARNLVNEPANVLFPAEFAKRAKTLTKTGIKVEVLTPVQMKRLGMRALLGVAQGSEHEARLVVMRWNGGKRGDAPIAFVGKGVTFDTGGVSIKPAAGMEDMKGDMAGAACVTGLMLALAKRNAKVNVIGAIGVVENAVDGKAQRPGDIVKSMSGQTIAVLNTDAEGRLVLADVLWYVQDRFKPKFMVDLATLTGAIMVALGKEHAGLFSNNDQLSERLSASGLATGEKVWRMPLTPEYDKLIDHEVADMKNIGGRFAGATTGAQFIQRFVNKVPWAHLDIAGTAMDSAKTPINQSWASGWGVRLLNHMVATHYET